MWEMPSIGRLPCSCISFMPPSDAPATVEQALHGTRSLCFKSACGKHLDANSFGEPNGSEFICSPRPVGRRGCPGPPAVPV